MRFVSIAELKNKTSEVLREVGAGEKVIVTRHGKPTAVLVNLSEDDLEDWLLENNPRLQAELDEAWAEYLAGDYRPLEEARRERIERAEAQTKREQRKKAV